MQLGAMAIDYTYFEAPPFTPFPVGGAGGIYNDWGSAVSAWANTYAPRSNEVEYGAIIYSFGFLGVTYYFIGETYQGYQTTNWFTVINGLFAGYMVGRVGENSLNYSAFTSFKMIGFAHTHPLLHDNLPSGPDIWMKRIGYFAGMTIFPIATSDRYGNVSINYF